MAKRRVFDSIKRYGTTVGAKAQFVGTLIADEDCIVYGVVEGRGRLSTNLVIAGSGKWVGDIEAANVLVAGEIIGDIVVENQLEILPTGRVIGRIVCPQIGIAEGAIHRGEIRMSAETTVTRFQERRGTTVPDAGKN